MWREWGIIARAALLLFALAFMVYGVFIANGVILGGPETLRQARPFEAATFYAVLAVGLLLAAQILSRMLER